MRGLYAWNEDVFSRLKGLFSRLKGSFLWLKGSFLWVKDMVFVFKFRK